jgi:hypothetical protein
MTSWSQGNSFIAATGLPFIRITNKPIIKKDSSFRTRVMTTQKRKTSHKTTEGPHIA